MPPDMPFGPQPHLPSDQPFAVTPERALGERTEQGTSAETEDRKTLPGACHRSIHAGFETSGSSEEPGGQEVTGPANNLGALPGDGTPAEETGSVEGTGELIGPCRGLDDEPAAEPQAPVGSAAEAPVSMRRSRRQVRRRAARRLREERGRSVRQRWLRARRLRVRRTRVRARRRRYGPSRPGPVSRGTALSQRARPGGTRRMRFANSAGPVNRHDRRERPGQGNGRERGAPPGQGWVVPSGGPAGGVARKWTRARERDAGEADLDRDARGRRRRFAWRRLAVAVVVVVILELALLGALVLGLAILCSATHCRVTAPVLSSGRPTVVTGSRIGVSRPAHHRSPDPAQPVTGSPDGVRWSPVPVSATLTGITAGVPRARVIPAAAPTGGSVTQEWPGGAVSAAQMTRWRRGDDPTRAADDSATGSATGSTTRVNELSGLTGLTATAGAPDLVSASVMRSADAVSRWRSTVVTPTPQASTGTADLPTVISNATNWLRGICAGLATMFATLAGVRWVSAREPSDVDRAKAALAASGTGFALALLAPQIVTILQGILGASNG